MQSYQNSPNIFELIVCDKALKKITIKQIEHSFGKSDEKYCYFNNILIGCIFIDSNLSKGYYDSLNINIENKTVIKLTPIITENNFITLPDYKEFNLALRALLNEEHMYALICEADCGQLKLEEELEIESALDKLQEFFIGENFNCPTFIQRYEI